MTSPVRGLRLLLVAAVVVSPLASSRGSGQAPPVGGQPSINWAAGPDVVIGKSVTLQSLILGQSVRLDIALPADYQISRVRYPVLFAFQCALSSVGGIVDGMSRAAGAPPMIVVAVNLGGDLFSLYPREGVPGSDRGPDVLRFFRQELEPYVDATYRTVPYRIVLGHSNSALYSIWAMFAAPDAIQAVLAAGPMFAGLDYVRVAGLLEREFLTRTARDRYLFFTQGDQPELTRDLAAFREMLRSRKPERLTWEFDPEPMANHNALFIRTLYDGLWRLFSDWNTLPDEVAAAGVPTIRAHKKALSERFGFDIGLGWNADARIRTKWLADRHYDALIGLASFNCDEQPSAYSNHFRLAYTYEQAGRWTDAVAAWEAAIATAKANVPEDEREAVMALLQRRLAAARQRGPRDGKHDEAPGLVRFWDADGHFGTRQTPAVEYVTPVARHSPWNAASQGIPP